MSPEHCVVIGCSSLRLVLECRSVSLLPPVADTVNTPTAALHLQPLGAVKTPQRTGQTGQKIIYNLWDVCVQKALDLMSLVPKRCNDMMNLGRLQGYEVPVYLKKAVLPMCVFNLVIFNRN